MVRYVFGPAPRLVMHAAERNLPPLQLLFLSSLLLIFCLDGTVRAAEEGGGLPSSSSPGDNGLTFAVGEAAASDPTVPGRSPISSTPPAGKQGCVGLRLPAVFSAVTLLLLPHSQGNIWLFEDSVVITGKFPGKFMQSKTER